MNRKIMVFALFLLLFFVVVVEVKAQGQFVGSKYDDVYHYPSCYWAEQISPENEVWFENASDAMDHGYRPCQVCMPPLPDGIDVFVRDVVDGDSFSIEIWGHPEEYGIRLADIDAPETTDIGYLEATEYLQSLIENKWVFLDVDNISVTDTSGNRYVCLAFVEYNTTHLINVNQAILIEGHAEIDDYTNNEFNPTTWNLYYPKTAIPEYSNLMPILVIIAVATIFIVFANKNNRL